MGHLKLKLQQPDIYKYKYKGAHVDKKAQRYNNAITDTKKERTGIAPTYLHTTQVQVL